MNKLFSLALLLCLLVGCSIPTFHNGTFVRDKITKQEFLVIRSNTVGHTNGERTYELRPVDGSFPFQKKVEAELERVPETYFSIKIGADAEKE